MALKINRGTTFPITVNYLVDGEPGDLTGATLFFTVKPSEYDADADDSEAPLTKTVTDHVDATGGISLISIEPGDTDDLDPETEYFYDIKVKTSTGAIYKLDEGKLTIDGSPTNRMS